MLNLKLQVKMGKSFENLKRTPAWKELQWKLLKLVAFELKNRIKAKAASQWDKPTGMLNQSWYVHLDKHSTKATIGNWMPYAYWQNYGVVSHQMRYLLSIDSRTYLAFGKYPYWGRKFIPITLPDGTKIFRRATEKGMKEGKWWHPGYEGKAFVEQGINIFTKLTLPHLIKDVSLRGGALKVRGY